MKKVRWKSIITGKKKTLVGVMHATREPWLSIASHGQLKHWQLQNYKNFEVVYFFSNTSKIATYLNSVVENLRWKKGRNASYFISYVLMYLFAPFRIFIPKTEVANEKNSRISAFALKINIPEMISTMRWKKIAFLKFFLESTNSDYAIIITSSSILNFDVLDKILKNLDEFKGPIYAGPSQPAHDCEFVSGSFTIINREGVQLLLDNLRLMPVHVMDDVAFGTAFKRLKVSITNIQNLNIDSIEHLNSINDRDLSRIAHFRLKSGSLNNRNDITIMNKLISRLGMS